MSSFKSQQCRLTIRERSFHFVSYEGRPANVAKNEIAMPSMWYMMAAGRRFPTIVCSPEHTVADVERILTSWALANAIAQPIAPIPAPVAVRAAKKRAVG